MGSRSAGPGAGRGTRERVAAFADPLTRMLLASDGFTTPVLEARLGTMLQVRVLRQDVVAAPVVGPVAGLLRLDDSGEALVRRSCLVDNSLSPVSLNLVVAPVTGRWPGLTSLDTPIGYSLLGQGAAQRRETVWVGRSVWRRRGEPCAAKAYVMLVDDEPVCFIRECFNPRHVPATVVPEAALVLDGDRAWASWLDSVPDGVSADGHDEPVFAVGAGNTAAHQPVRPDPAEVAACVERLRRLPPLVSPTECRELAGRLASAVAGEAFVLQLGDCAETFADCAADGVRARQAVLAAASGMLAFGAGRPVVAVRRIVGQYPEPRPRSVEPAPGIGRIPAQLGDVVNGFEPEKTARKPGPQRMMDAYFHCAATLNYLRAHPAAPAAVVQDVIDAARRELKSSRACGTAGLLSELGQILDVASAAPAGVSRCLHSLVSPVCISHEALVLPYEEALTQWDRDGWWNCSAHMVWIGDRTCNPQGAHVRFAAQIGNPIAVQLGPTARPADVTALCALLNPHKEPGRLALVAQLGARQVRRRLPALLDSAADTPVVWMCDPTNTDTRTWGGRTTRWLDDVTAELREFFAVCRERGVVPGGVHLEAAGEPVTECVGGGQGLEPGGLEANYRTRCDPRLNPVQVLECVAVVLDELRR
jgi:3-deoxy-D-arabino-heptulosonate 7-phosphate (DAHP) synthase class II